MAGAGSKQVDAPEERSAEISECGRYRYSLVRRWALDEPKRRRLLWVMLNPSTADASIDDPTIRKCRGFAERLGFNEFEVVNLFAWRATDPADLGRAPANDVIGPDNNATIRRAIVSAERVLVAWGAHPMAQFRRRDREVLDLVRDLTGDTPECLAFTKRGQPGHPLMLGYRHAADIRRWFEEATNAAG